jgi:shikimate kinase
MGAGKTTVGRTLAQLTGKRFVDSDHEIEARTGVKVSVIFDIEGEAGFRDREQAMIDELTQEAGVVLATGGGAVLRAENRVYLASRGMVVYLHGQPEDLYKRIAHDRSRPILRADDPLLRMQTLYGVRDPLYREVADLVVNTGRQSARALAVELQARLQAAAHGTPPQPIASSLAVRDAAPHDSAAHNRVAEPLSAQS